MSNHQIRVRWAVFALGLAGLTLLAQAMPRFATVAPDTGKAGTEFTAEGENLTKDNVSEVYLTDGKIDLKVEVVNQTATAIKFKAPASAKPGRFNLMVLTTGASPKLLEQPVKLTIE